MACRRAPLHHARRGRERQHRPGLRRPSEAIRDQHKLRIGYRDAGGVATERTVWPFALAFFEGARVLAAWCELRGANRHFRIDRIASAASDGERYPEHRRALIKRWRAEMCMSDDS
ncbi:WYL domain-containing protein [Massilia sp. DJPM01]|uniref:helix-turn-helix transcriptional regulator n=1 Tax=Massilia sp. DJPM01 TaxID=3024404 RepID=UPI00259DBFB6|nr:WYL domain-containing protein [Massilia sp. DJPM01]MDM5177738.1 WYL domain-containing protein [Massilia sp. DJPM01]